MQECYDEDEVLTTETTEINGLQTSMHDSPDVVDVTPNGSNRSVRERPFSHYKEPLQQLPPQEVPWFQEHKRRRVVLPGEELDFQPWPGELDAEGFERGAGTTGTSAGTSTGGRPGSTAGKLLSSKNDAVRSRFHSGLDLLRTAEGDEAPQSRQGAGQWQSEREGIHPFNVYDV
mmetsp:Transcript_1636/g.3364  ORF Transcript_1636/g.3364 Transcript_1636/m.3364 type:complete len:174 (+) Transcript_1636:991-1512(+)